MQVEIKMLLGDTSDYHRLTSVLAPLFISEESYTDYFFDFPSGSLTEGNSVLRLRVPCAKPNSCSSPVAPCPTAAAGPGSCEGAGHQRFDIGLQHESIFLSQTQRGDYQYSSHPNVTSTQAATFEDFCRAPASRQQHPPECTPALDFPFPSAGQPPPAQAPRPFGKMVFKQNNTVEKGHQMNFVLEDKQVPPGVVDRLLSGRENPFEVLRDYATHQERLAGSVAPSATSSGKNIDAAPVFAQSPASAAGRIVERLQYTAQRLREASGGSLNVSQDDGCGDHHHNEMGGECGRGASGDALNQSQEVEESNRYYGNVRYAAGALSHGRDSEQHHRARQLNCDLVPTGHYTSTRKTYRYLQPRQARVLHAVAANNATSQAPAVLLAAAATGGDANPLTPEEQQELEWRSQLLIRVDKTLYPFGEKYEVEIPKVDDSGCGGLLEDVMAELTKFLTSLQVKFQFGSEGKYQRFISGKRSMQAAPESVQDVKLRLTNASGYHEVRSNLEQLMGSGDYTGPKRHLATTDLDTSGTQAERVAAALQEFAGSTEIQENFFFDGPNGELAQQRCFLRLRRSSSAVAGSAKVKFVLVLKENNTFSEGTQSNRTSKTTLSEDVARALMDSPATWLDAQHEHNAVANTLRVHFQLRTLHPAAFFTTNRITVPWWSANCQRTTIHKAGETDSASVAAASAFFTQAESFTQLRQQLQHNRDGVVVVPPLLIHLDCSQYRIPVTNKSKLQRAPFSQFSMLSQANGGTDPSVSAAANAAGEAFFELYEIEVTNISSAAPSTVMEELTAVLDGMGVEWQTGIQSKLDQYSALVRVVNA